MSTQNDSFVIITENNSMMETKASFNDIGNNNVDVLISPNGIFNSLLEEYEIICQTFDDLNDE
mgnify:CR=1 FL=1